MQIFSSVCLLPFNLLYDIFANMVCIFKYLDDFIPSFMVSVLLVMLMLNIQWPLKVLLLFLWRGWTNTGLEAKVFNLAELQVLSCKWVQWLRSNTSKAGCMGNSLVVNSDPTCLIGQWKKGVGSKNISRYCKGDSVHKAPSRCQGTVGPWKRLVLSLSPSLFLFLFPMRHWLVNSASTDPHQSWEC